MCVLVFKFACFQIFCCVHGVVKEAGKKVGLDQLGPPVWVGSTRIDLDQLGSNKKIKIKLDSDQLRAIKKIKLNQQN